MDKALHWADLSVDVSIGEGHNQLSSPKFVMIFIRSILQSDYCKGPFSVSAVVATILKHCSYCDLSISTATIAVL